MKIKVRVVSAMDLVCTRRLPGEVVKKSRRRGEKE